MPTAHRSNLYDPEEILYDPAKEKKLYEDTIQLNQDAIAVKSIRIDAGDFWDSFVKGITQKQQVARGISLKDIRTSLRDRRDWLVDRDPKTFKYKSDERGVVNPKGKHKYTTEQKGERSKPQSVSLMRIPLDHSKKSFAPPIFGWNRVRRSKLGVTVKFCVQHN